MARDAHFQPANMAALCSISLRQLERYFSKSFHKTPTKWNRELRLRLAQNLIAEGWSNKAVASKLCFSDSAHLCHEFRKMCGVTPQYYGPIHTPQTGMPKKQIP